jgi:hypothetical protein
MRQRGGVEQREIRRIRHHACVQERVLGQTAVRAKPHPLQGRLRLRVVAPVEWPHAHEPRIDGAGPVEPGPELVAVALHALRHGGNVFRSGNIRHWRVVVDTLLADME